MLYTYPNNCFPDLNYFKAPFCIMRPQIPIDYLNNNPQYYIYPSGFQINLSQNKRSFLNIEPSSQVELEYNPIATSQSKPLLVTKANPIKERSQSPSPHSTTTQASHNDRDIFAISSVFPSKIITEFNTNVKLKKVHSTYHLKRKIATKLQNDIKTTLNDLIEQINIKSQHKLPYVFPNSKEFREDVKIESLRVMKTLTIGQFISEDINAGRSLNKDNSFLIESIQKMNDNNNEEELSSLNIHLEKLTKLINKTYVNDYYESFYLSKRYTQCYMKDIKKYEKKLSTMGFAQEKYDQYVQIFKEKYEGIARSFFLYE